MKIYPKMQTLFKRDMNTHKIIPEAFSRAEFGNVSKWCFTEKIDGCLEAGQEIETDVGPIKIGKIVNDKLKIKVASYNFDKRCIEFKEIAHYHKEERCRPFVNVWVASRGKGNKPKVIVCTDNHKFRVGEQWIKAKNLKSGMRVMHRIDTISEDLKQFLLGSLLGDSGIYRSSLTTRGFSFRHSTEQSDYFEFKKMLLDNLFHEGKRGIGGYPGSKPQRQGSSRVIPAISDFIKKNCEVDGEKKITSLWADNLNPLAIAIWYMDDGSCAFTEKQRGRAHFATNGFSKEEVSLLSTRLDVFGIENGIFDYKGSTIVCTANGTEKLFNLIYPYITESMKYKLFPEYKDASCVLNKSFDQKVGIEEVKILEVSDRSPSRVSKKPRFQYDISVKGNLNYFTKNILVHNTNIRIEYDNRDLCYGPWRGFTGRTGKSILPNRMFLYLEEKFKLSLLEKVFNEAKNAVLFGEGYGAKIQKGGGLYREDNGFILFDVYIDGWWLERESVEQMAHELDCKCVPVLPFDTMEEGISYVLSKPQSLITETPKIAEGVVAKSDPLMLFRNGNMIAWKLKVIDFFTDDITVETVKK